MKKIKEIVVQIDCNGTTHLSICDGCESQGFCRQSCADRPGASVLKNINRKDLLKMNLSPGSLREINKER